ncbi:4-hydroxythreonine-4-phosphate dehydrogenase PdxA [Qipengyuania sp. JC766]|uniref:4-hydroxythreonine-4-phosphate dehydrogenase PdxA n=1 Tax=Qipengyuania sp. JC766 TaxID=3232139 RepID=UPI0034573DC2
MTKPLALALGDPAGIGPEIVCASWARRKSDGLPPFFAVGGHDVLAAAAQLANISCPVQRVADMREALAVFDDALPVLGDRDANYRPGAPDPDGAKLALHSLEIATHLAREGDAGAVVTSPVAKSELKRIGFDHPGQTEYLASACLLDPEQAVMMLAGPSLRAVPLTVHCALAQVPALLTRELIVGRGIIVARALRTDFGIDAPRIAVTGLNPHAGEGGQFGAEERDVIEPAIAALRDAGVDASGPHPADALFAPHKRAGFDAALCMYHDQALIPVKALDFDQGVNVTLGLPIVRTSPDHGTAFDIAGRGIARPEAMIAAIRMAGEMAERRARA